ncbi:30S ribosomal protein S11 [Candidatus Borreliella tachyglossi]|uniref:Small ribosomal subunit protein uS11 n=1 Tax=Candidatus Borreliella tachyglossi TaxID=1964448 RepID=A0A2S1LX51_9SPIR|nr:30S ribosomal protein S11 [Candidatus Borreliella tachyglossi]AWG42874.1 30S ribosomal protein S11 [Candidatus Borreliella tachyglossi]
MNARVSTNKKKVKRSIGEGNVYIQATFNNTIVTVSDIRGNTLAWASAGGMGFKGAKKSTPYAAQITAESALGKVKDFGINYVHVFVKGPGIGRESAIRAVGSTGMVVRSISDVTPIPHNGCRPKKTRRV